jgi:hypothetical protein
MFAPKGLVGLWHEWLVRLTERAADPSVETQLRTEPKLRTES